MHHQLIGDDRTCIVCGAVWLENEPTTRCSGRTDEIHTYDLENTGHPLDCTTAALTGTCEHLAVGCDCRACNG